MVTFFLKEAIQRWIEILNLDPKIKSHRICANHFEKSDFGDGRTNKVLKKGKKPSKNIPVRQFLSFVSMKETCSSRSIYVALGKGRFRYLTCHWKSLSTRITPLPITFLPGCQL